MAENFVLATVAGGSGVADLIFIHGLTGDPVTTWTSSGSGEPAGDYWPKWIYEDIPGLNVYTLGYPASLFERWVKKELSLYERAKASLEYLASYGFGERPIGFVAHSLGGLLAKQIVRTGFESSDERWRAIAASTRLMVFLATPHTGAAVASVLTFALPRLSSKFLHLLRSDSSELDQLNAAYRRLAAELNIKTVPYYETWRTKKFAIIVDRASADPGTASTELLPAQADHISICKPGSRASDLYLSLFRRIADFVQSAATKSPRDVSSSVRSCELSVLFYSAQVAKEVYIVLPFDGRIIFSVPLRFIIAASAPVDVKNLFLHLEMSDSIYLHRLERTFDKLAAARDVRIVTDQGRSEHIARVLYKIPRLPPAAKFVIHDFIFAKSSSVIRFDVPTERVERPVDISAELVTSLPIAITLDGEDVMPWFGTVTIHFRQGDIEDFKSIKREENRRISESKGVKPAEATFIGFKRFVKRDTPEGLVIVDADFESAIGINVRITPRGLEPRNEVVSL